MDDGSKDTVPETGASLTEMLVESTMDQLKDAFFTNGRYYSHFLEKGSYTNYVASQGGYFYKGWLHDIFIYLAQSLPF